MYGREEKLIEAKNKIAVVMDFKIKVALGAANRNVSSVGRAPHF